MASIMKATVTLTVDFSSDTLNKDAGDLVKDAVKQIVPIIVEGVRQQVTPVDDTPKTETEQKK